MNSERQRSPKFTRALGVVVMIFDLVATVRPPNSGESANYESHPRFNTQIEVPVS